MVAGAYGVSNLCQAPKILAKYLTKYASNRYDY